MEKGVRIEKLSNESCDAKKIEPSKKKEVEEYLSNMKPRSYDKVPEEFWGKGPNGYMLYDWAWHRSRSAPNVTSNFKDIVRFSGTNKSYLIKDRLRIRSKTGGVRFAL